MPLAIPPKNVKKDTEINNGERELTVEQYIIQNFKTTTNNKDRLHTEYISCLLTEKGYNITTVEAGRLFNRIGLGKYNEKCNVNGNRKKGFDGIKYLGANDEV